MSESIPLDKDTAALIRRLSTAKRQSKENLVRDIAQRQRQIGVQPISLNDLGELLKTLSNISSEPKESGKRGMVDELKDFMTMRTMMVMSQTMTQPSPAVQAPTQTGSSMDRMWDFMLLKMMTKPEPYEMQLMDRMGRGDQLSQWQKDFLEDAKEQRQLLKSLIEGKEKSELRAIAEKHAEELLTMRKDLNETLTAIQAGQQPGASTLEQAISEAIKSEVTDFVTGSINRGLFRREEVVKPEGGINWGEALNRMFEVAEKAIEKLPAKAPPMRPIKRADGVFVDPRTGQPVQPPPPMPPGMQPPAEMPARPSPEVREADLKKRSKAFVDDLVTLGASQPVKTEETPVESSEAEQGEEPAEEE